MDYPQVHGGVILTSSRTSSKCLKILPKTMPKTCLFSPYKFWHFLMFCYLYTNNAGAVCPRKRCLHDRRVCSNLFYINLESHTVFLLFAALLENNVNFPLRKEPILMMKTPHMYFKIQRWAYKLVII